MAPIKTGTALRPRAARVPDVALEAFNERRDELWSRIFATALHVHALYTQNNNLVPKHERSFDSLCLNASEQTFRLENLWEQEPYSRETLTLRNHEMIQRELDDRLAACLTQIAEDKRVAAIRTAALDKLSDEEKSALGLTRAHHPNR